MTYLVDVCTFLEDKTHADILYLFLLPFEERNVGTLAPPRLVTALCRVTWVPWRRLSDSGMMQSGISKTLCI